MTDDEYLSMQIQDAMWRARAERNEALRRIAKRALPAATLTAVVALIVAITLMPGLVMIGRSL